MTVGYQCGRPSSADRPARHLRDEALKGTARLFEVRLGSR